METQSLWKAITPKFKTYSSLSDYLSVDVIIIGGGITGVTTAYELIKKGKKVAILEAGRVGNSTTGDSTGNLYVSVQKSYGKLLAYFNRDEIHKIIRSRQDAIDYIEKIVNQHHIECDFLRRPSYYYTNDEHNIDGLEQEVNILKNAGIAVAYCTASDVPFKMKKAMKFLNNAKINPFAYVKSMAEILENQGGIIFENSPALSWYEKDDKFTVLTDKASISATHLVMATHVPKGISLSEILSPAYRSYAVACSLKNAIYPNGRYVDWDKPHYVTSTHCSEPGGPIDCLVVAGSHHRVGIADDHNHHVHALENFIRSNFEISSVHYHWSAQHYQASDGVPYIGQVKQNYYIATGFYADGLVYGTVAGKIISEAILDKTTVLNDIYSPQRHHLFASISTLTKESLNAMNQYLHDFPGNVEAHHFKDIANEEAKTIEIHGEKFGAYRDDNGELHVVCAVCTHMKCIVKWNNFEKTWDCPCHGSRFTTQGVVLEGPAYRNLIKLTVKE